jgi:two-component system chemotaxis response regulator CheV
MARQEILLDSGTNEVELAEFVISGNHFGVNVAKIREFIPYDGLEVTRMPGQPASIAGVFLLRDHSIPLVDLRAYLELPHPEGPVKQVVVVTEFNKLTSAFIADRIERIHRVSWSDFCPLNHYLAANNPLVTGSVSLDKREVLVLDLESIMGDIFPESVINYDENLQEESTLRQRRAGMHLFFAEDSAVIRTKVGRILNSVGYENVRTFDNGQEALDAVKALVIQAQEEGRPLDKYLNLILTDIEMPQMDGLTLCRQVKQDLRLQVPVIIFSSLINQQMALKCNKVGAEAFASKPETERLLALIDHHCLGTPAPD